MSSDQLIRITSWNVAGRDPTNANVLDYLFDDSRRAPNSRPQVQVVGLQEAPQYLFSDPWTTNLSTTLKPRGYVLFKRHKLSGILLYIFVLREILLYARDFETESVKTGLGGLSGNKGGVSLRFTFNGNSFSVTNSHLAAHQEYLDRRVADYHSIMDNTKYLIDANTSSITKHDYSFWFGDLNFRLDGITKGDVLDIIEKARYTTNEDERLKLVTSLYKHDQLTTAKEAGRVFDGFNETLPKFLPTYKFQIGSTDRYDAENRIPAWTDRILFRRSPDSYNVKSNNASTKIEQIFYESLPETELSDHKPVVSMFRVTTFDPSKFNPSSIPYKVVEFLPITGWKVGQDGRVWYKITDDLFYQRPKVLSSWDRLALYKVDFVSLEDFVTVVFVNNMARMGPRIEDQQVPYQSSNPPSRSSSRRSSTSSRNSTDGIAMGVEAVEGDGFKYFTSSFSDDFLMIPGRYVVLYLKNEFDVYGISEPFDIAQR